MQTNISYTRPSHSNRKTQLITRRKSVHIHAIKDTLSLNVIDGGAEQCTINSNITTESNITCRMRIIRSMKTTLPSIVKLYTRSKYRIQQKKCTSHEIEK